MSEIRVEILLATFNGAHFLEAQLDSLINQTHPNFSILIRDDNSSDQTFHLITRYQKLYPQIITILPSSERLGIIGNYNELLKNSSAKFLMFCDQDDVWFPDKIANAYSEMCALEKLYGKEKPLLIHTDLEVVDGLLKTLSPSFWKFSKLDPVKNSTFNRLLVQNTVTGCTMMINQALKKIISDIPNEVMMHDWWIALIAAAFGKIVSLKEPSIFYRQHSKNSVGAKKMNLLACMARAYHQIYKTNLAQKLQMKRLKQAQVFNHFYGEQLKLKDRQILRAFLGTEYASWWKKKYYFFRYRFFRNGLLRNVISFLLPHPF